jgi:hypothetical protein
VSQFIDLLVNALIAPSNRAFAVLMGIAVILAITLVLMWAI